MKKKLIVIMSIVILAIIAAGIAFYFNTDNAEYMSYKDFYSHVEKGDVASAQIGENEVRFYLEGEKQITVQIIQSWIRLKNFYSLTELK